MLTGRFALVLIALALAGCETVLPLNPEAEKPAGMTSETAEAQAETKVTQPTPQAAPEITEPAPAAAQSAETAEATEVKIPDCPAAAALELNLNLIDYIDCTADTAGREFKDQTTSKVVEGPAGKYRVTAPHRHAFFAYKFKSAGKNKPVAIIISYPDDEPRMINFSTHESGLTGRANSDWSLETGVYTGGPFPLSKKMQYHSFIYWPQEDDPAVIVSNFSRQGNSAAAGNIWVYEIEGGLPPLEIDAPDADNQRQLGHFNSFAFLPTRLYFGLRSKDSVEHMLDYCQYIGINELSWCIASNNDWGVWTDIPSMPSNPKRSDRGHLERVLKAMDARGGFSFIACMGPEHGLVIDGEDYTKMTPERMKEAVCKYFDELLEKYGKYKSLKGISLASQYGAHFYRQLQKAGITQDVVSHIKSVRPDMQVINFLGGYSLHREYFNGMEVNGEKSPTPLTVLQKFQSGKQSWNEALASSAKDAWRVWGQDVDQMKKIEGLDIFEQYQSDDFGIFPLYANQPRSDMYYDLDVAQQRSDLIGSPYAAIWNTHFEGWLGLHPDVNFWNQKLWVAPDFTAAEPLSMVSFTRTLGHHDRLNILPGSWNNKYFGHEARMRKFAKAYRSLPPVVMDDIETSADWIQARWCVYNGKRYVSIVSKIAFNCEVTVDGEKIELEPYDLVALKSDSADAPVIEAVEPVDYIGFVLERQFRALPVFKELQSISSTAANQQFMDAADAATKLQTEGKFYESDMTFTYGMARELQLRLDVLKAPELDAARLYRPFEFTGSLDSWPKVCTDLTYDDGSMLAGHLYYPNSWSGPEDLSARLRLAHDKTRLYIGCEITDSTITEKDSCTIRVSTDGAFLDPISLSRKCNIVWQMNIPQTVGEKASGTGSAGFKYTATRTETGVVIEATAEMQQLNVKSGGQMGFVLHYNDSDGQPNEHSDKWAADAAMLIPCDLNFQYWDDARTCGKLIFKR